jgi:ornithine--oxo-acid transaminase
LKRSIVHASTFSENSLSMRAGLATLDVLENQRLGDRAANLGMELQQELASALAGFEMVQEVRGKGLLLGIQFTPPRKLALRAPFEAFAKIHPAMFGQILVMRMFRNQNILTQICGNDFMVLKVAPPLVITSTQIAEFVSAIHDVVDFAHHPGAFWSEALGLARRAMGA